MTKDTELHFRELLITLDYLLNYATEECTKAIPELKAVSATHKCASCAYEREGFCIERRAKK